MAFLLRLFVVEVCGESIDPPALLGPTGGEEASGTLAWALLNTAAELLSALRVVAWSLLDGVLGTSMAAGSVKSLEATLSRAS